MRFLCNSLLYKKNVFINVREMIKSPWDFHGDDLNAWIMDWSSNIVAAGSEMVWINRHWFFNLSFAFWDIEILTWYLNMIQNQIPCIPLLSKTNSESRILKFDRNGFKKFNLVYNYPDIDFRSFNTDMLHGNLHAFLMSMELKLCSNFNSMLSTVYF